MRCIINIIFLFLCLLFALLAGNSLVSAGEIDAQSSDSTKKKEYGHFELDEMVVTANRSEDPVFRIARNVSVITSEDIQQATSNNVVDLLSREAGLNLRTFFGHDKYAAIDIRGMGETSTSNVIVMVDGFKLNAPDLSGPDYSSVPLDQIERIEIIRGAGSVLYGGGAVGGVINIITKKGETTPGLKSYSSCGSYETYDERASFGGKVHNFSFNINADYYDSDGYRDNGYFRKKDIGLKLGYDLGDHISFTFLSSVHKDSIGFPGPVAKESKDSKNKRKDSDSEKDYSETTDKRYLGGIKLDLTKWGTLNIQGGYRDRENPYILGFTPLLSKSEQRNIIDEETRQFNLGYNLKYKTGTLEHRFLCGYDYYSTDYLRETKLDIKKFSDVRTGEWFASNEFAFPKNIFLNAGYRKSVYKGRFSNKEYTDFFSPPVFPPPFFIPPRYLYSNWVDKKREKKRWENEACDIGLTYILNSDTSFFAGFAKSYRNPNVDELSEADEGLSPQKGMHWDLGLRRRIKGFMEFSLTLFQIRIEDEIYYGKNPDTNTNFNRNYEDRTRRRGIEVDLKLYPVYCLYLWGNYSFTEAKFEKEKNYIPLVPKHKGTIGFEWHITERILLSSTCTFVGPRFDGNDQKNNQFDRLKAYEICDSKVTYLYKGFKIFAGVNNLFDELYSTTAYSETYYPMPTRNFYAGIEMTF
jgi:outer membrane cobalamin receptor